MKITIDEAVCKKHNLSFAEVIGLLLVRNTDNAYSLLEKLENEEKIVREGIPLQEDILITNRWDDEVSAIILESDDTIPSVESLMELASKLREVFPKGMKIGSSAWRGNVREITLRLQKFFKLYGTKYTLDQIFDATKRYVETFNGDYSRMRILKYFILKHDKDTGEDISDLATFLENDCVSDNADDWLVELR